MNQYENAAKKLAETMLNKRRQLVQKIDGSVMLADLQMLRALHDTIALAREIQKDETALVEREEFASHKAAGTLVEDGYGGVTLPEA